MQVLARRKSSILLAALIFVQVLMVGQQLRSTSINSPMSYWSGAVLLPFQRVSQWVARGVSGAWQDYVWLVDASRKNQELDAEAARLRIENHYLQQHILKAQGQAALDDYRSELASTTLAATVIARGPSRTTKEIFLNRGTDHGVRPGMAVVVPDGIVGKVEAAYGASSMVVLLGDSEFGAGVVLERSGAPAVLRCEDGTPCRLDYVGPHVPVAVGELVYTSGLDGVFPLGMPVAQVVDVQSGNELQAIAVRPLADLDRLREVAVVLKSEAEALPERVKQALQRLPPTGQVGPESQQVELIAGTADRIKQTYRSTLESQAQKIGLLSGRPPDFSAAADSLRAAQGELASAPEGTE